MSIDWEKPVQTRDGRKARVLCTDMRGTEFSVVALVDDATNENLITVNKHGRHYGTQRSATDLINAPVTITRWVNVYSRGPSSQLYQSKADAITGGPSAIARVLVEITYTPGEGLED